MTRELMPLHNVHHDLTKPGPVRGQEVSNLNNRIAKVLRTAEAAGIAMPAEVTDLYAHARALHSSRPTDHATQAQAIAARLAAGDLTPADADSMVAADMATDDATRKQQAVTRRRAAERVYVECGEALREAGPALHTEGRERLAAVVADQAKTDVVRSDLTEVYEALHAFNKAIAWVFGCCQAPPWFWRFQHPEAVWAWAVEEADRQLRRRPQPKNVGLIAEAYTNDGAMVLKVTGVEPTLLDVATHAELWLPDLVTGPEIIANADRIERDQRDRPHGKPQDAA